MNTNKIIYNGLSIRNILCKLPLNMAKIHKKLYINNCLFVYRNELKKYNLDYCKTVRNSNFHLISFYLSN